MCPPVSPSKGAFVVKIPAHNVCVSGMETLLRERSGGHIGTAPTVSFGQIAYGQLVSFGEMWGGGYFFRRTSRPSYLQMASIHSSGMGMEWFSSRS